MTWTDDARTILSLEDIGNAKICEGERLILWGKSLIEAGRMLSAQVEKDPGGLETYAREARVAMDVPPIGAKAPEATSAETKPARKTRSDKDVPRGPKKPTPPLDASPAQVQNGETLRALLAALKDGPLTMAGLRASSAIPDDVIDKFIAADSVITTWTGKREGDKDPVLLIGTIEQRKAANA